MSWTDRTEPTTRRRSINGFGQGTVIVVLDLTTVAQPSAGHATAASSNAVRDWNVIALKAIAADKQNPLSATRAIAMVRVGIYDAVRAITTAADFRPFALNGGVLYHVSPHASLDSAVADAASTILLGLVPGFEVSFISEAPGQGFVLFGSGPPLLGSGRDRNAGLQCMVGATYDRRQGQ